VSNRTLIAHACSLPGPGVIHFLLLAGSTSGPMDCRHSRQSGTTAGGRNSPDGAEREALGSYGWILCPGRNESPADQR